VSCPYSPEDLSAYVDGEAGEGIDVRTQEHLKHCARCAQIAASFKLISTTLRHQPDVLMRRSVVADVCSAVAAQQQERPLPCRTASPMASALLDGELAPAEAARVRAHLSACEACQREFALMRSCAGLLGERQTVAPPPTLRPRILQAVADVSAARLREGSVPRTSVWRRAAAFGSSAAVAAALVVALLGVYRGPEGSRPSSEPDMIAENKAPNAPVAAAVEFETPSPAVAQTPEPLPEQAPAVSTPPKRTASVRTATTRRVPTPAPARPAPATTVSTELVAEESTAEAAALEPPENLSSGSLGEFFGSDYRDASELGMSLLLARDDATDTI
jgi:anti-sigma factor RsiW